jgi:flavin reductase (DIM6/NTAB) family NADH-FMN oxidoreductase RutF
MRISKLIFPRSVALITTCSKEGKPNVASFSFIMPISFEPKYVGFSIAPGRHSFSNLKQVPEFVLNLVPKQMLEKVKICGSFSGRYKDKFKLANLEIEPSIRVRPPRIKDCPIQLECKVVELKQFGDHYLVVGEVLEEHVKEAKFDPLMHISGEEFASPKRLD